MRKQRRRPESKAKERARAAVKAAIKRGDLVPNETCEDCGNAPGLRSDGRRLIRADHHVGYDVENHLNVRWICPPCDGNAEMLRGNTTRGKWAKAAGVDADEGAL